MNKKATKSTGVPTILIYRSIQLGLKLNNLGSFSIGSYTNNSRIGDYFSNSEAGSSYLPNLAVLKQYFSSLLGNVGTELVCLRYCLAQFYDVC